MPRKEGTYWTRYPQIVHLFRFGQAAIFMAVPHIGCVL